MTDSPEPQPAADSRCETCRRPSTICVCDRIVVMPCKTPVLILQHPQEPDVSLGTAQLLAASLPSVRVRVGLSWPNLGAALGEAAPGRWGVLWRASLPDGVDEALLKLPYAHIDHHGNPVSHKLDGLIALDGTWSQAKTLWWRNPWLLRLDRVLLVPAEAGIYGRVRKEPNRHSVSTLEAVADGLVANGEPAQTRATLRALMRTMVQRARDRA